MLNMAKRRNVFSIGLYDPVSNLDNKLFFFLNKAFVNEDPYCPRAVKCIERTEGPVFTLLLNGLHFNGTGFVNVCFTNMMNEVYPSFQK